MENLRKVKYFKYITVEKKYVKEYVGEAKFHKFGISYEEFFNDISGHSTAGNFSTAIIELSDGTVKNIEVELIQFKNSKLTKEMM